MKRTTRMTSRFFVAAAFASGLAGCSGCREDHPFIPYSIDGAPAASIVEAEDAGHAEVDDAGAAGFAEKPALAAPANATTWNLEGVTVVAPAGRVFALGLAHDFDGDGAKDVFAIVRETDSQSDPGELLFFRGQRDGTPAASELLSDPNDVVTAANCTAARRLGLIGQRSVFVELGANCPSRIKNGPSRYVAVAAIDAPTKEVPVKPARLRFSAYVNDPIGAPTLTVSADGTDRDADGIEDVALRVTVEGGGPPFEPGPKVSAVLKWLDRSSGLSREAGATEASFLSLASVAMARAGRAKEAPQIPRYVHQIRALFRAVCPEGGAPRLVRIGASDTSSCGQSRSLEEAGLAEVKANVTMGDPLRAISALDRAQRFPATRTASRTKDAENWITQATPFLTSKSSHFVQAVPQLPRGQGPSWGPLAFEPDGKLLVRTQAAVVRIDPATNEETTAEGIDPWSLAVSSPDAHMSWIEAYDPCDGVALRATFASTSEGEMKDVVLPIPPPFGKPCASSKGIPARAVPIAWGPRGLEVVVAGEPVLVTDLSKAAGQAASMDQPFLRGSPRSPDGKVTVIATAYGLLVRGATSSLYRVPELDGHYGVLRFCAVSSDRTKAACVRNGRVVLGVWDAP